VHEKFGSHPISISCSCRGDTVAFMLIAWLPVVVDGRRAGYVGRFTNA